MAESQTTPKLTGAFELFGKSSKLVQNNLTTFVIIYLLPFLINLAQLRRTWGGSAESHDFSSSFSGISGLPGYAVGGLVGFGALFAIVFLAVWLILNAMTVGLQVETSAKKKPKLDNLWPYAKKYWLRLFGLSVLIALFVIAGLILFIIPGLIMIRRYFLAPYVLVDQDVGIWEAMSRSAAMTKPHSGSIWAIIGVTVLISLPSAIPLFGWLITFVLALLYSVAPALRYQELKKLS